MADAEIIKVLLVEDDEDDFIIARSLFGEIKSRRFTLEWAKTFSSGLTAMTLNQHDICLVDYRLGAQNGVELLRAAMEQGCQAPVILLTGAGEHEVDLEAMQAGAADYLVKTGLEAKALERSIRYALQRKRAAALAAFEQARLAAFGTEIGLVLSRRDSLESILTQCAKAMALYLNAELAQISTFDVRKGKFENRVRAGALADKSHFSDETAMARLELECAAEGKPVVIKQLTTDRRVTDQAWVKAQGLISCATYPLVLEEKLVGLMSIFTQHPLTHQITQEMGSVANGIALCVERKRSEDALGASEVKYRSVVENIREVIFQLNEFGTWAFLNPAWTAITGFEVEPTLGTLFLDYIHPDDREYNRHVFLQLMERKLDYCRYETRFLTKDGKVRWVEVYSQPTHDHDGALVGSSGSITDVTERKLAETEIKKLAAFPRVNPNPVLEFAMDGTLTYANDAAFELAKSLDKQEIAAILPSNAGQIARDSLAKNEKRLREEVNVSGRTITWSFFPVPVNQVVHCYGSDITEVLNLEAQFRHAQKLESVGQLAAGIAHDFNNILTVIQGYADTLLTRVNGDKVSAGALKQVSAASRRAAGLTRQLLMFSRKQMIQLKVLDLSAVLKNLQNMLPRLLGEDIVLEASYASEACSIEADTGMIEQVVMNLAVNSRDAMPNGGKLSISTSTMEIDANYVRQHADSRTGHFSCLTVTDTGCGMDRKTLDRIFEPFFSTKEVGKGTGLGLATVYGIVKQHQGWLEVTSAVGVGTTFKIFLPAVQAESEQSAEAGAGAEPVRGGKETILLVEDEPVVRELVRDILRDYEYEVLEATTGVGALQVWDEHDGKVDLLLTDMVMPEGMSGRELAKQLKSRKRDLKIIYSSGYSSEIVGKDFDQSQCVFLAKPYLPVELAKVVRDCLDSAPKGNPELAAA